MDYQKGCQVNYSDGAPPRGGLRLFSGVDGRTGFDAVLVSSSRKRFDSFPGAFSIQVER